MGPASLNYHDENPQSRKFLKQLKDGTKIAHGLKQIEEVEEQESDGSIGDNKYRSPAKQSRERRKRRNKEREQETIEDKGGEAPGEDFFLDAE